MLCVFLPCVLLSVNGPESSTVRTLYLKYNNTLFNLLEPSFIDR